MGDLAGAVEYGGMQQSVADDQEQRKVVVLGVPWQTEDSTLETHFGQFGAVEEAQIMRERYTGKSRGFGFVTFAAAADAQRAVAAEHLIDGRRCEAKFALPEGKVGSARTTRIFVARIPSSVSDLHFRAYFEQFGTVQDAYMPKDPSKQGHRGIGFVTYASSESVERVMAGTHVINGNEIAIDRATPKERTAMLPGRLSMSQPNLPLLAAPAGSPHGGASFGFLRAPAHGPGQPMSPPRGYEDGGYGGGLGGRRMSHPALSSGAQFGGSPPAQGAGGRMGQMPLAGLGGYGSSSGANLSLLTQAQAQAAALQHHLSSNSLSSLDGSASSSQQLINLINANVAAAAAAAGGPGNLASAYHHHHHHQGVHPSNSSTGQLPGSAASSNNDLAGLLAQQQDQMAAGGGQQGGWGMQVRGPGPPPGSLPTLPPAGPFGPASARAGPRIFVGKLNRETSEQDVKDYFGRFGYVLDVYLPRDKNNKREHRGFGFVTFETDASIQRVVSNGPHQIRGSIVAIDSAVPRQEEMILTLDGPPHPGMMRGGMPGPLSAPPAALQPDREAEALQAFEALGLDGSGNGSGRHPLPAATQGLSY